MRGSWKHGLFFLRMSRSKIFAWSFLFSCLGSFREGQDVKNVQLAKKSGQLAIFEKIFGHEISRKMLKNAQKRAKNGQKRPFLRVFRVIFKVVAKSPLFFLISFKNYVFIIYRLREIFGHLATSIFSIFLVAQITPNVMKKTKNI